MKAEELAELAELIEFLSEGTDELLPKVEELAVKFRPVAEKFADFMVDINIRMIKRYMRKGLMTQEDAMAMVLGTRTQAAGCAKIIK